MDVIDRINVILKERGMSGADLTRQIGLSTAVYSQWNRKKTKPSNKNIVKVAEVLNIPVSDLTGEVQKESPLPENGSGLTEEMVFDFPGNVQTLITGIEPTRPSGKRLEFILHQAGYEPNDVANTLNIDFAYLDTWMKSGTLPPYLVVQRVLDAFQLEPTDLLNRDELELYVRESQKYLERKSPSLDGDGLSETARQIMECVCQMSQREQEAFLAWLQASQGRD